MNKVLFLIVVAVSLVFSHDTTEYKSSVRAGIGGYAGINDGGISGRVWVKEQFGLTLTVGSDWDREKEGGELLFNYKFQTPSVVQPYLFAGGGVQRVNIPDVVPPKYNVPVKTMSIGAGAEALLGHSKRHGVSLEAGYRNGLITYRGKRSTDIGTSEQYGTEDTMTLDPLHLKLAYHFYFIPSKGRDRDGDGVMDRDDRCPKIAEDMDGFHDEDGCPDSDNDGDGIADSSDSCINESEDMDGFSDSDGCPDSDNDSDGIADAKDSCPGDPEDLDGFEDLDGCTDRDNDKDGFADSVDHCKNSAETVNDYKDEDGCPDTVTVAAETPKPFAPGSLHMQMISFEINNAEILKSSYSTIEKLKDILLNYPDMQFEIQGHTCNIGSAELNRELSQKRAEAVVAMLVERGVPNTQLRAVGYADSLPVVSNNTGKGRAKNRRVEIAVVE